MAEARKDAASKAAEGDSSAPKKAADRPDDAKQEADEQRAAEAPQKRATDVTGDPLPDDEPQDTKAAGAAQGTKATPAAYASSAPLAVSEPGAPANSGDSGPGTGTPAPTDTQVRSEATLTAAADADTALEPAEGYRRTSTNPVAATAGRPSYAGENHHRFLNAAGSVIASNSIFAAQSGEQPFRVVEEDTYEEFTYPNTSTKTLRLLYPAGAHVPLGHAAKVEAAATAAAAQVAQGGPL